MAINQAVDSKELRIMELEKKLERTKKVIDSLEDGLETAESQALEYAKEDEEDNHYPFLVGVLQARVRMEVNNLKRIVK